MFFFKMANLKPLDDISVYQGVSTVGNTLNIGSKEVVVVKIVAPAKQINSSGINTAKLQ